MNRKAFLGSLLALPIVAQRLFRVEPEPFPAGREVALPEITSGKADCMVAPGFSAMASNTIVVPPGTRYITITAPYPSTTPPTFEYSLSWVEE